MKKIAMKFLNNKLEFHIFKWQLFKIFQGYGALKYQFDLQLLKELSYKKGKNFQIGGNSIKKFSLNFIKLINKKKTIDKLLTKKILYCSIFFFNFSKSIFQLQATLPPKAQDTSERRHKSTDVSQAKQKQIQQSPQKAFTHSSDVCWRFKIERRSSMRAQFRANIRG